MHRMDPSIDNMLQALEKKRRGPGFAGIQMKKAINWQRHDASTGGVTQDTPSTGTHTLHPRPFGEQLGIGSSTSFSTWVLRWEGIESPFGEGLYTRQMRMSSSHIQHLWPFPNEIIQQERPWWGDSCSFTMPESGVPRLLKRTIPLNWLYHFVAAQIFPRAYYDRCIFPETGRSHCRSN